MMAEYEYIEKQAAIEQFKSVAEQQTLIHDLNRRRFEFKDIVEVIGRIPPTDVRPVVHSEWVLNDNRTWFCKNCKSWIPDEQRYYANWCIYCGAKMEG